MDLSDYIDCLACNRSNTQPSHQNLAYSIDSLCSIDPSGLDRLRRLNRRNQRSQLHECLAQQIRLVLQTSQNVIVVLHGPISMTAQLHRFIQLTQTAQNVIEKAHGPSSMTVQLHDCLAPQICPKKIHWLECYRRNTRTFLLGCLAPQIFRVWKTAENVIEGSGGPTSLNVYGQINYLEYNRSNEGTQLRTLLAQRILSAPYIRPGPLDCLEYIRTNIRTQLHNCLALQICYFHYILGTLPSPKGAMELPSHGVKSMF